MRYYHCTIPIKSERLSDDELCEEELAVMDAGWDPEQISLGAFVRAQVAEPDLNLFLDKVFENRYVESVTVTRGPVI